MIKAIFFDIDGTLKDFTEKDIRPSTYEANMIVASLPLCDATR